MARALAFIALCFLLGASPTPTQPPLEGYPQRPALPELPTVIKKSTTRPAKPATQPAFKTVRGKEGFWRIVQTAEGVWWFQSPTGKLEFLNAVTTVQPYQLARERGAAEFVSTDFNARAGETGDLDTWAQKTLVRVRDAGFKSLGAWCNPIFHKYDVPITRDLNLTTWMLGAGMRFYDPKWPELLEKAVKLQVEPLRDNRNLVGYYTDNELDWGDHAVGPAVHFDNLPPDDPNRKQVLAVVRTVWPKLADFNADWKTSLSKWDELDTWKALPRGSDAYARLFSAWLSHLARDYYKLTTALVRKYDDNHLILGVRFKAYAPNELAAAARDYTDAQSINVYPGDAKLDAGTFGQLHELSGQPIIISEYAFHSLDGRSGNRNTFGFSAQVLDQQARADAYRLFTTRLARVPYIIGADWFQWMDEPPSGRTADGEDVNFGIVDIDDRPYELLVEAIRKTTPQLNPLHAGSYRDDQKDIWRESFAKPVANVPFLDKAPALNGELSDWPQQSRVKGIRHSNTIGLERSKLPVPNVFMGWTNEGLYVGLEIFDNDIHAASFKGWWWTRDCVEMWVSTRPVTSDQTSYNEFCHQFFFVPVDSPVDDHFTGIVGQWKRDGDALKENLIPHPQVREAARIMPDRYVVEMFFPAKSLNGFDPVNQRSMALNLHVRNYQHAIEYFWSAPKEMMTQIRPSTWGHVYLENPAPSPQASVAPATQPTASAQ